MKQWEILKQKKICVDFFKNKQTNEKNNHTSIVTKKFMAISQ